MKPERLQMEDIGLPCLHRNHRLVVWEMAFRSSFFIHH